MSARLLLTRTTFRRQALGAGIGLSIVSMLVLRQPKMRMDARPVPRPATATTAAPAIPKEKLDPDLAKQISGGSVTGFLAGILISVFSKTLVLLLGISVVLVQVAARYGVDLVGQLRMKQRLENSRVLAALQKDPAFKISFGLFFAMSGFMTF